MAVKELYVGNLFPTVTVEDVRTLLSPYGVIHDARVVAESQPENQHAYAFVTMEDTAANEAILALDGEEFMSRTIVVEEAKSNTASDETMNNISL